MAFDGIFPPLTLPVQDHGKIMLLADRWHRAAAANANWAQLAKECVDFFEGKQWTEAQLRVLEKEGRPALKFNKIAPIVRLILGYHGNNKSDITALPSYDGTGSEQVAEALSRILKQIAETNQSEFVDTEVFMDGIVGGRGWFDQRISFEENDLGEVITRAKDPFAIYPDPDAQAYDLSDASFVIDSRWGSIDEIEANYGKVVADLVEPFTRGQTPIAPLSNALVEDEITPVRRFGQSEDGFSEWWESLYGQLGEFVDQHRRSIRIFDFQYWVREIKPQFIDLETGARATVPDHWSREQVEKALYHAENIGNPMIVQNRLVRRVRWTTMIGDMLVYDKWSMYDDFTLKGFFPYFRRGVTRGMVEDLLDPQREINKRRSAQIDAVMRTPHSGWSYHKDSMTPEQKRKLRRDGQRSGFNLEWEGEAHMEPQKIQPSAPPTALEHLETRGNEDMREISGVNESALGELDKVQSGRAIEAKQRQAVISVQLYMDNFRRTKHLVGRGQIGLIQKFYTEERTFRILGEDGQFATTIINQEARQPGTGAVSRLLDVTLGKYVVSIDETPLSATFANAQFDEMMLILEKTKGALPVEIFADVLVDLSSMPRKDELKQRIQAVLGTMGVVADEAANAVPGGAVPTRAGPGGAPSLVQGETRDGGVVTASPAGANAA